MGDVTVHQLSLGRRAARRSRRPASVPCHGSRRWPKGRSRSSSLPPFLAAVERAEAPLQAAFLSKREKAPLFRVLTRKPPAAAPPGHFVIVC